MLQGNLFITAITAVGMGLALGFILQRGRFCLNSAFRDIIFMKDMELFRAYLLSVAVAVVGSNLLDDFGLLRAVDPETGALQQIHLMRQGFVPLANILGGFLFGIGIVLAGGCASGMVFRVGEGQISMVGAVMGFFFGVVMTTEGLLSPVHQYLKSFKVEVFGKTNPALWDLFGGGAVTKWATIGVFTLAALVFVMKGKPSFGKNSKTYSWGLTGLLIGILTIASWLISSYFGGVPRGLAITTPIREFFNVLLYKSSHSIFPEFSFLGMFRGTWGVFFILAVPFGALLSAIGLREFKWKIPPAKEFLTVLFGSIIMGIGAVIAGGCNLGHGVTGFSTLAISSIVSTMAIILGNWTMVYFKFIKPMND
ncbi:MAG: YeeE/YedE family protein [Nitrospiraceae bacterium]|nr:MAG: YeeE/YedE family protein [Nitrospiraceae bacterium]